MRRRGLLALWVVLAVVTAVATGPGCGYEPTQEPSGAALYARHCAACHGADGKGNPALGAPNLTDSIWLYGGSLAAVTETVSKGRGDPTATITRMPAHKDLLDPAKIRILTAYVWGLSNGRK